MKEAYMGPGEPLDQLKWERSDCVTFCGAIYEVYLKNSFKNLENVKFHSFQENGLKNYRFRYMGS